MQKRNGHAETQLDAVLHARPGPIFSGDSGPFVALIEADETAIGGQGARDAQRTGAGEGADFDGRARADSGSEDAHKGGLLFADLHAADVAQGNGFCAQFLQDWVIRITTAAREVTIEAIVERQVFQAHEAQANRRD